MANIDLFPEDICLAIKQALSSPPIVVPDEDEFRQRISVNLNPRYVFPEPELADLECPSLTLFESSVIPDLPRRSQGDTIVDEEVYDSEGKLVSASYREKPIPHVVFVDIRSYTSFDEQRDTIRREVLSRLINGLVINGTSVFFSFIGETPLVNITNSPEESVTDVRRRGTLWRFKTYTRFDISLRHNIAVVRDYNVSSNPR